MAAVETFWQMPEDEDKFFEFLDKTGCVMALPKTWVRDESQRQPSPFRQFLRHNPRSDCFLLLNDQSQDLRWMQPMKDGLAYQSVDMMKSPVMAYTRCHFNSAGKLCQSNLSAYTSYFDPTSEERLQNSGEFTHWLKKVLGTVRRQGKEWIELNGFGYRATKRGKEAVDSGKFEVAL